MGWLMNLVSGLVVFIAVVMTIFTNYPAPPFSPILFQWKDHGRYLTYKDYNIFYKGKNCLLNLK